LRVLALLRAEPQASTVADSSFALDGEIAAARMHLLQQQLGGATRGEGVLELTFARYEPVSGAIPTRPRSDYNPLNRNEYLLHLARRVDP
jgi:ribosomal protection tetracycline resistance protein